MRLAPILRPEAEMTSRNTLAKLCALALLSSLAGCADSVTLPESLASPSAVSAVKSGANANAKLCQKGGYLTLRASGRHCLPQ